MSRRNIANFSTFNSINSNEVDIQSYGTALTIYGANSSTPIYTFDPNSQQVNLTGNLHVTGEAQFTTIAVSEFAGGIFNLAASNTADLLDIGISGEYINGTSFFTGLVRDANDSLRRWTFYEGITTIDGNPPSSNVSIDSTLTASVRMNKSYVNDGTLAAPSMTFDSEYGSGIYRVGAGNIGISILGTQSMSLQNTQIISRVDFKTTAGIVKNNTQLSGSALTLSSSHYLVECSSTGSVSITLPQLSLNLGREYIIIKTGLPGVVTINTNSSSEYIDNGIQLFITLNNQYDRVTLIAGSTQWYST
jgi:hypothetical protein